MIKRPNIVILNPDQMRADSLHHLGNEAAVTPILDALSEEGVSFSRAFCQNPVCTPSRCSFMSGWYPHVAGHRTMTHMMHEWEPVLLKELKDSGYQVWMNQRNDLLPAQNKDYYKPYCTTYCRLEQKPSMKERKDWRGDEENKNYYSFYEGKVEGEDADDLWTQAAVEFIRNYDGDEPFCIFLPWMNPHPVYRVTEPYYSRIDRAKLPERIKPPQNFAGKSRMQKELARLQGMQDWSEAEYDELRAVYLGMCSKVDHMTGMILDALKEKGCYEDTAVFFFSDHGDYTGDYDLVEKVQNCFEDCLTNVPFLVKLPQQYQIRHGRSDELVELIDFYATAADIAQLPATHTQFGKTLLPYLQLQEEGLRKEVFCEGGFRKGEEHCKETGGSRIPVRESLYYPRQFLQASDEMYNGKAIMYRDARYKYIRRLYEEDEFYDLERDPKEVHNLIGDSMYQKEISACKEKLLTHLLDTADVVPFQKDVRMEKDFIRVLMS